MDEEDHSQLMDQDSQDVDVDDVGNVDDGDDEDDDRDMLQPAFFIQRDAQASSDGPPADGLDYLLRVRREAQQCKAVVVANNVPPPRSVVPMDITAFTTAAAPPGMAPSPEWEQHFVAQFNLLREKLANEPLPKSSHGSDFPEPKNSEAWRTFCCSAPPSESDVLRLDHVGLVRVLANLTVPFCSTVSRSKPQVSQLERQSQWLYALLAKLDLPLDADTSANLRELLRAYCIARASLDSPQNPALPHINIIITILAKVFKQQE